MSNHYTLSPEQSLRVGIIGNRDLSGVDRSALTTRVTKLLTTIKSATRQETNCYLVNSLAEGADQLVALAAQHAGLDYNIWCPLPFPAEEYKRHFYPFEGETPKESFDKLTAADNCQVVALNAPTSESELPLAYAAAATLLLENTDLLVAIHDPQRKGSTGGTQHSIRKARQMRIPSIEIDIRQPAQLPRFLPPHSAESPTEFDSLLQQLIQQIESTNG